MEVKKQSTAPPPKAPRRNRPRQLWTRIRMRSATTPKAAMPTRKRTKAICAPGSDAFLATSAMVPNISDESARRGTAGGFRTMGVLKKIAGRRQRVTLMVGGGEQR